MSLWSWRRSDGSKAQPPKSFGPLVPGWRYQVVRTFRDYDGIEHIPGERWRFDHCTFLPYEDGLSLFVISDDGGATQIRLQTRPEAEGPIARALENYLLPVSGGTDRHVLMLTRDSVCMADDVHARHAAPLEVYPDADARGVAPPILNARYLAWTSSATWSLALGDDQVVFGWGCCGSSSSRCCLPHYRCARAILGVDVSYHAQTDPAVIIARLARNRTR